MNLSGWMRSRGERMASQREAIYLGWFTVLGFNARTLVGRILTSASLQICSGGRLDCRGGRHSVRLPQYSCYGGRAFQNWRGLINVCGNSQRSLRHQPCFRRTGRPGSTAGEDACRYLARPPNRFIRQPPSHPRLTPIPFNPPSILASGRNATCLCAAAKLDSSHEQG